MASSKARVQQIKRYLRSLMVSSSSSFILVVQPLTIWGILRIEVELAYDLRLLGMMHCWCVVGVAGTGVQSWPAN